MPGIFRGLSQRRWFTILLSVLGTLVLVLLALNLTVGEKKVTRVISHRYSVNDPQFARTMGLMLGPGILSGNSTTTLRNGAEIFPAMLDAIKHAEHTITFETYIYWSGEIGKEFADALSERARSGVKVHMLVDWVGSSKMDAVQMEQMEKAGVEIKKFHPLHWYNLARMNNRTHRKLLIIDGKIGFTGGVGVADQWTGNAQDPDHWRDTHFVVEGPVVGQMQSVMLDNWTKTTGKVLHGQEYFPLIESRGNMPVQVFSSSPTGGSESMELMYLLAITAAEHSIHLSSSYFVPDDQVREALVLALKRGVKVQIITPGKHMDAETVRRASRGLWGELLEAGAEMYEYEPTMFHCKVLIVDAFLSSIGSTNFDDRSMRLNDEANLNIYDSGFAKQQIDIFKDDLRHAKRITLEQWRNRPFNEKVMEHAASLLGFLL